MTASYVCMWVQCVFRTLCNLNVIWMQCECNVNVIRMQCECNLNAMWMQCECNVNAMWMQCEFNVNALWTQFWYKIVCKCVIICNSKIAFACKLAFIISTCQLILLTCICLQTGISVLNANLTCLYCVLSCKIWGMSKNLPICKRWAWARGQ